MATPMTSLKKTIKKLLATFIPLNAVLWINRALRNIASAGHHLQFARQWQLATEIPHVFDPFIDLYWRWGKTLNPMSWERGIFGLLAMKPGCRQLDLCCGEGFYTQRFYSSRAGTIIGMDYNNAAIKRAKRNFSAPNIEFRVGDIRSEMPDGPFDNITWDAGIEYFTLQEIEHILSSIKLRLTPEGILSGYSLVVAHSGDQKEMSSRGQKYAASREALGELLNRHFRHVVILRTAHADAFEKRINHYFFASDGSLPFDNNWTDFKQWIT